VSSGLIREEEPVEALAHLRLAISVAGLEVEDVVLPAERDEVVGGLRVHYLDWGRRDCAPIVFLHGGCLTAHTWDLVCLALRADSHCLAIDQRGHGDSEWSPTLDYGPDAHVRDVRGLIEQLGLTMPVLVGQSLGGLNAMTYAAESPDQLAGVVLVDVGPDVQSSAVERITDFVTSAPLGGSVEDFVERAQAFNPRRDPRLLRYSLLHNLRQLPDGTWTWKYDRRGLTPAYVASVTRQLEGLRHGTDAITCPVLLIRGAESDALSDAQAAGFVATLPNGQWARVENAGHTVQGDNPSGLVQVIADFLAQIRGEPR
jgi:esterase